MAAQSKESPDPIAHADAWGDDAVIRIKASIDSRLPVCVQREKRLDRNLWVLVLAGLLGVILLDRWLYDTGTIALPEFALSLSVVGVIGLAVCVMAFGRHRRDTLVRESNWLRCERCLYDLTSVPSPGQCPECGRSFRAYELRKSWRLAIDRDRPLLEPYTAVEPGFVSEGLLERLRATCPSVEGAGLRDPLKDWPEALEAVELARAAASRWLEWPARLTRAILFDKPPGRNWTLEFHQDVTVALAERMEAKGFGPWSQKEGVWHAEAPDWLLERMVTVRIHLDDADEENGCLLVQTIDGHRRSLRKWDAAALESWKSEAVPLVVKAGDAVIMCPLTPHASGRNSTNRHRRVLHMEFAAEQPGQGLRWRDEAEILGGQSSSMS